jgi:type IV secretion system protein VirB5
MNLKSMCLISVLWLLPFAAPRPAAAQWAVIDVSSIQQQIQQYQEMEKQLANAVQQLERAAQLYASLTGDRGMAQLLSGAQRNYLPTTWAGVSSAMQGGAGSGTLGGSIQSIISSNAVLSTQNVSRLSPTEQALLSNSRQVTALLQALTRTAIGTTSSRFTSLQQLINAIPTAKDSKGALDLQARVSSENTMQLNDNSKLQALYQSAQAEQWAAQQRQTEQAIQDIGSLRTLSPMGLR